MRNTKAVTFQISCEKVIKYRLKASTGFPAKSSNIENLVDDVDTYFGITSRAVLRLRIISACIILGSQLQIKFGPFKVQKSLGLHISVFGFCVLDTVTEEKGLLEELTVRTSH